MSRILALVVLALVPPLASAQTKEVIKEVETMLYVLRLQDETTGGFKITPEGKPSLRACNGGLKTLKSISEKQQYTANEKTKAFILSCYDPATGAFAEPGGKPDVAITSIGVMAAVEAGIPREKFPKAMMYLNSHAKTFEDMRIAAAAVEAWGVKDCGFDLTPWLKVAAEAQANSKAARDVGSAAAMRLRLGQSLTQAERDAVLHTLAQTQRDDGGWGMADAKTSDIETTYRVMRCLMLLKEKPRDVEALKGFLAKHRNKDGGLTTKPGEASSMSGAYYVTIIEKWLKEKK